MKRLLLLLSLCLNHMVYPEGFIAGTPVKTPTGYVPIEQIKAGDQVYSYDFKGHYCIKTVILTIKRYTETLVKITIDDESFFTTPDQFFISTIYPLKWTAAINLKTGDGLVGVGKYSNVSTIELVEACAEIYTLSVAGYGNFAVSTHNIFAHNWIGNVIAAGAQAAPFAIAATEKIVTVLKAARPYIPVVAGAWYRWKTRPSRPNVNRHSEHPYYNSTLQGNPWPKDDDPNSPWSRWNNPHAYDEYHDPNNPNYKSGAPRNPTPKTTTCCGGGGGKPPWDPDDPIWDPILKRMVKPPKYWGPKPSMDPGKTESKLPTNIGSDKNNGAQAPGIPKIEDGYRPPKNWDGKKVNHPKNRTVGWPDNKGNVWVPTGPGSRAHGGPHWDVQHPNGKAYTNVYPGGKIRPGKG